MLITQGYNEKLILMNNVLLRLCVSPLIFLVITGCSSAPTQDVVDQPLSDSAENQSDEPVISATAVITESTSTMSGGITLMNTKYRDDSNITKDTYFEVLFSEPSCKKYSYTSSVKSIKGTALKSKPHNIFCRSQNDLISSGDNHKSPQFRMLEWINDPNAKEIIFSSLSFRNQAIKKALCERTRKNEINVSFIMSVSEDTSVAEELKRCNPQRVNYKIRGLENGLGYYNIKMFMVLNKELNINQDWKTQFADDDKFRISIFNGNLANGPVINFENWNFITTAAGAYFSQLHLCVYNSVWEDPTGTDRVSFMKSIKACRNYLADKGVYEEKDIKAFFAPGEGQNRDDGKLDNGSTGKSAWKFLESGYGAFPGIKNAQRIWIGAHRFFYNRMNAALKNRLYEKTRPEIRFLLDDDMYYRQKNPNHPSRIDTREWLFIEDLASRGAYARFFETNSQDQQIFNANYFLLFRENTPVAVYTGGGEFTAVNFTKNMVNSYYITIPTVVGHFRKFHERYWKSEVQLKNNEQLYSKATPFFGLPALESAEGKLNDGE